MSDSISSNRRAAASDGSLHAVWNADGRVTIRNRAWQVEHECQARHQGEFDAICKDWGIEVKAKRR